VPGPRGADRERLGVSSRGAVGAGARVGLAKSGAAEAKALGPKRKGLAMGESFLCIRIQFERRKGRKQGKSAGWGVRR
jgi:hypothetical protein